MVSKFKKALIDALSEEEMLTLSELLIEKIGSRHQPASPLAYLEKLEVATLFGYLHHKIFGEWCCNNQGFQKIMENLDQVRGFLAGAHIRNTAFSVQRQDNSVICLKMPIGLRVNNEFVGNVLVSGHAWERFCECFYPKERQLEKVSDALLQSFARAKPIRLTGVYEIIRLINNKAPAEYFLDTSLDCRFVVTQESNQFILRTVESPRPH